LKPDGWALFSALAARFGAGRPLYALMLDFAFAIPASVANAEQALALGAGVLVYPGGDWDV
jgi:hypothetical protein